MITVVNKRTHVPTGSDAYVGRPSPLGNPFRIGPDGSRDEVIAKYRKWLWERVQQAGSPQLLELEALHMRHWRDGKLNLVCWCAPERCHADVIKSAIEWIASGKE